MATDGPTPKPCDPELHTDGTCVLVTHTIGANGIELYVKMIAYLSKQKVDWHYFGGRARVLAMGDIEAVREAIQELTPLHETLMRRAIREYGREPAAGELRPFVVSGATT